MTASSDSNRTGPSRCGAPVTGIDFREIVDGLSEMVCRFLPDGTILYANEAYCRTFGLPGEALVGRRYEPVVHPDDLERVQALVGTMTPENPMVVIENRIITAEGGVRWTQWTNVGFFDDEGRLVECQSAGRDITDRVEAEQALRRSHERFRFLAEATARLSDSLDPEQTLSAVARQAVPFLADICIVRLVDPGGRLPRQVLAHVDPEREPELAAYDPLSEDEDAAPGARRMMDAILAGEPLLVRDVDDAWLDGLEFDAEGRRLWGNERLRSIIAVPLAARGRAFGTLTFATLADHSGRRYDDDDLRLTLLLARRAAAAIDNARLHAELQEQARRKDEFLATLAHELRNPMSAITTAIEVLRLPDAPEVARARALEVVARQARQQARLVDDLLDVSRLRRGKVTLHPRPVEVGAAIAEIAELHRPVAEAKGLALVVAPPEAPLHIEADPARLQQIVGNLLDNAVRHTPPGGHVHVGARRRGGTVRLAVRDDGAGIAPDVLPGIFELFAQGPGSAARPTGSMGIGLTVVRRLAELHGGSVEVYSAGPGQGSEFVVVLPLRDGADEAAPGPSAREGGASRGLRVVLVEDNEDAAQALALLLRRWGHDVTVVHDGDAAVEAVERVRPDLALVDIGLPGIDGYETARRLRASPAGRSARLVALTGYTGPEDVERARAAGFDDHAAKPLDPARLRAILDAAARG